MTATETVLANARIVLRDEIAEGTVLIRDGRIADVGGVAPASAEDMEGDYVVPGLVELHTDHLEGHYAPRPKVRWIPRAAVLAHDAQIAASGITTVFDALRVGDNERDDDMAARDMDILADTIEESAGRGLLRADHLIHLRCEVSAPNCLDVFESMADRSLVRLASLMDHAPGQRQFADIGAYKTYYQGKLGMTDAEFEAFCDLRVRQSEENSARHRSAIAAFARDRDIVLASHDDATDAHVDEAVADGVRIAEFPTTESAARSSHGSGMSVLMGAPNVVRGGSHSGNIAAQSLAEIGVLDILSSDYIPYSLMHSVFMLAERVGHISLPQAVAMASANPATSVGLDDRGEIAAGRRADLVRVHVDGGVPVIRTVWREGRRVV